MGSEVGREALLRATVRVVAKEGLRGLTYRAVANEAGVTHGMVSYHFGTRDALMLAAFREQARSHDALARLATGSGEISAIGSHIPETVQSANEEERYQYEMILEALRQPKYLDEVRILYRQFLAVLEDELELAGVDEPKVLARVVFAALDGLILQQLITGDSEATADSIDALHGLLRNHVAVAKLKQSMGL